MVFLVTVQVEQGSSRDMFSLQVTAFTLLILNGRSFEWRSFTRLSASKFSINSLTIIFNSPRDYKTNEV